MLFGFDLLLPQLPATVALGAVAVIGYLLGRHQRALAAATNDQSRRDIKRARLIAADLERITQDIRKSLAQHHASVARFKTRVSDLSSKENETACQSLCLEAEEILRPTMQFAAHIAQAYDQIRQQSTHLMTFTEVRTDALTGVSNRRAMDDSMETLVAMKVRYQNSFAIAICDIDNFKAINDQRGHVAGDEALQGVARLLDDAARETDIVARYGGEEFVVLMPQTSMAGAATFAERVRATIERKLNVTVSIGVAEIEDGESGAELLGRADKALYHAKHAGRNLVALHDGQTVETLAPRVAVDY